jgi:hypothetical protein
VGIRDLGFGSGLAVRPIYGWLAASVSDDLVDRFEATFGAISDERRVSVRRWAFGFAALSIAVGVVLSRITPRGR